MRATLLFLSILLFSFSPKLLLNAAADPVYDFHGNALQTGHFYHIAPFMPVSGGGVTLTPFASSPDRPCPLAVVQALSGVGSPWTFRPADNQHAEIQADQEINIRSHFSAYCRQSTWWRVDSEDSETKQIFIGTTGVDDSASNFKIEKYSGVTLLNVYKITYNGDNVGRYRTENGLRRLAVVNEDPFLVIFSKADDTTFKSILEMV